jgi:hypothetical protein
VQPVSVQGSWLPCAIGHASTPPNDHRPAWHAHGSREWKNPHSENLLAHGSVARDREIGLLLLIAIVQASCQYQPILVIFFIRCLFSSKRILATSCGAGPRRRRFLRLRSRHFSHTLVGSMRIRNILSWVLPIGVTSVCVPSPSPVRACVSSRHFLRVLNLA